MRDTHFIDADTNTRIKIGSPEWRIKYYLTRVGAEELSKVESIERKKIFLLSVKDFLDGTISLDEMSGLATQLWRYPSDMRSEDDSILNDAIYAASKLNFYVRKIPEVDTDGGNFVMFMSEVKQYFAEHFDNTF